MITPKIYDEIHKLKVNNLKPNYLYLGCKDYIELKQELQKSMIDINLNQAEKKEFFMGLEIVTVIKEKHFQIA